MTSHECANLRLPILFRRFSQRNLQVMHQNYLWDQWRNRSSRNLLLESWIFLMFFFFRILPWPTTIFHHRLGEDACLICCPTHTISKESKLQTLSCHLAAVTRVIQYLYPKAAPPRGHLHQLPLHHHKVQVPVPPVPSRRISKMHSARSLPSGEMESRPKTSKTKTLSMSSRGASDAVNSGSGRENSKSLSRRNSIEMNRVVSKANLTEAWILWRKPGKL